MRSIPFLMACVGLVTAVTYFNLPSACAANAKSIDDVATHDSAGLIKMDDGDHPLKMNAFCLNSLGQIIAACGNGPGEVRILDNAGKIIESWKLDVKPEAINVADDDTILVGGEGKLFRFDSGGSLLNESNSPHADKLRSSDKELRTAAIAYLDRMRNPMKARITSYKSIIEQLEQRAAKGELNASEERTLEILPKTLARYEEMAAARSESDEDGEHKESAIKAQVESLFKSKLRISSISSSGGNVFVATRGIQGYGYDVWKMDREFANADVIVTGLSGCCGQMDVQCCEQGIFVAENSRDRVVHFDTAGKEITHWGKSDRTGIDGFTSCCNPMNVCFDKEGNVYTAESSSGRIKRFDQSGNLLSFVGDVDLVPGCKNVSIAVSPVNDNIYMLDLTRNHIKLMQPKSTTFTRTTSTKRPGKTVTGPVRMDLTQFFSARGK